MSKILDVVNSDFSAGFYNHDGIQELVVANGWTPWWKQGTDQEVADGFFKRPEFKPESQRTEHGQKWFTTFATHMAGIYQVVPTPPGAYLTLNAGAQYWSEHTDGSGGGMGLVVGIDPKGDTDPFSEWVIWGDWMGQDSRPPWDGRAWQVLSVECYAEAQRATIYLKSECRFRAKHNDAYWNGVQLLADYGEEPPPSGLTEESVRRILREELANLRIKLL